MKEFEPCERGRRHLIARSAAVLTLTLTLGGCRETATPPEETPATSTSSTQTPTSQPLPTPERPSTTPGDGPTMEVEPSPLPSPEPLETDPPIELPDPIPSPEPVGTPTAEPTHEAAAHEREGVVDCMVQRCIALTFDDGPGPYTGKLLDYLDDYDARATFFVVGSRVDSQEQLMHDIVAGGHQIGGHSWDHDDLTTKSTEGVVEDTQRTNQAIEEAIGEAPTVMRPPYGATNNRTITATDMPHILWSMDTEDWRYRDSDYVAEYVLDNAERGDIVLMHDIHNSSVEAVPDILQGLTEEGYVLVTVDEILGNDLPVGRYSEQTSSRN